MCKFKKGISAIVLLSGLLLNSANAALVELVVVGNIERNGLATVDQLVNSPVTIRAVYDTSIVDRDPNIGVGRFSDFQAAGETALISASVATDLGTIEFITANVSPPGAATVVTQVLASVSKTLNTSALASSLLTDNGFTGVMGNLTEPESLLFALADTDMNNYLFTDPNVLLSGNGVIPADLTGLGGIVSIYGNSNTRQVQSTDFGFSVTSFSVNAVPVPASIWLFGSGLIGLMSLLRRKKL